MELTETYLNLENGIAAILCRLHDENVIFNKRLKATNKSSYSCLFSCLLEKVHGAITPGASWRQIQRQIHLIHWSPNQQYILSIINRETSWLKLEMGRGNFVPIADVWWAMKRERVLLELWVHNHKIFFKWLIIK